MRTKENKDVFIGIDVATSAIAGETGERERVVISQMENEFNEKPQGLNF